MFAEDEEQVDKLLALADRAPNLKHIVYSDPRGMRKYDDPRLMEAEQAGRAWAATAPRASPASTTRLVDATEGEDVAILCTTSGTTANPKLAMLAGGPRAASTARPIWRSIRRGRTTNMSRCCRCPGSWNRSTRSAKGCSAG